MSHELPEPSQPVAARSYGNSQAGRIQPQNLADILERVLDKGIVIAGDIQINLLEIELLTIKIRLLVASVDKAEEMGIDWWRNDPMFSSSARSVAQENAELKRRIEELEAGNGTSGEVLEEDEQKTQGRRR
ncbi:gas vesicle protein [Nocardioides sp. CER19]|uniref:gas vesicle protein n=1 Tax=Nocardioides sp. CER19 TaxID=3038538 RepID=UPI00244AAC61|nr:gas vesicle protein [Nocardioides sp. CER19]MDH2415877.1 gas vesicle protein [Nocardioides sp. CER19]